MNQSTKGSNTLCLGFDDWSCGVLYQTNGVGSSNIFMMNIFG